MTSNTGKYVPPQSQDELVLAWLRRARESQLAHYEMANILSRRGRMLGFPVILLTSMIGTSVFSSIAIQSIPTAAKIVVGALSVTAVVLSSLQTFFGYSDRAEKHRNSAARFGATRRKLESVYATGQGVTDSQLLEILRQELDSLAQESLHVPAYVFDKVQKNPLHIAKTSD